MLGRKLSEQEKNKLAATFLQAIVRGFLARLLARSGAYMMTVYIKTLRHDPAEQSESDHDYDAAAPEVQCAIYVSLYRPFRQSIAAA
jgi:hypothetical protein